MGEKFANRETTKTYLAVVRGYSVLIGSDFPMLYQWFCISANQRSDALRSNCLAEIEITGKIRHQPPRPIDKIQAYTPSPRPEERSIIRQCCYWSYS